LEKGKTTPRAPWMPGKKERGERDAQYKKKASIPDLKYKKKGCENERRDLTPGENKT